MESLCGTESLSTLLLSLRHGSPRLQRLAIRLLGQLVRDKASPAVELSGAHASRLLCEPAPFHACTAALAGSKQEQDDIMGPAAPPSQKGSGEDSLVMPVVKWLHKQLGCYLLAAQQGSAEPPLLNFRNGEAQANLAAELVSFCHLCLRSRGEWGDAVRRAVQTGLSSLSALLKQCSYDLGGRLKAEDPSPVSGIEGIEDALAALAVAGGHTEPLREGGQVQTITTNRSEPEIGTVVELLRHCGKAKVRTLD